MKEIIKSYFSNESIVGDQIESVNNFVATRDNPESIMQRIVDETKVTDDDRPGMISLDRSKTGGRKIEIYFGREENNVGFRDKRRKFLFINETQIFDILSVYIV